MNPASDPSGNYKGMLLEFLRAKKLLDQEPFYEYRQVGEQKFQTRLTLSLQGKMYQFVSGSCTSKKLADHDACKQALEDLQRMEFSQPEELGVTNTAPVNYKGPLLEWLRGKCSKDPEYTYESVGAQLFRCILTISLRGYRPLEFVSKVCPNKKAADQDACRQALETFEQPLPTSPSPSSSQSSQDQAITTTINYKGQLLELLTERCSVAPEFNTQFLGSGQGFRTVLTFQLKRGPKLLEFNSSSFPNKQSADQDACRIALEAIQDIFNAAEAESAPVEVCLPNSIRMLEEVPLHEVLSESCLRKKSPRPYQQKAYENCMLGNSIVVFPTGKGKTLVASMIMSHMSRLNPKKLAVMVVDRIPLVFQQADSIELDTNLSIAKLCGETVSNSLATRVFIDREFHALVITAGLLLILLNGNKVKISDFSVMIFDECHHATGDSPYKLILDNYVAKVPESFRPRTVGLTASPVDAKTAIGAEVKLEELCTTMLGAAIYRPKFPSHLGLNCNEFVKWVYASYSRGQAEEKARIVREFYPKLMALVDVLGENEIAPGLVGEECQRNRLMQLTVLGMKRNLGPTMEEICGEIKKAVLALELNDILGPQFNNRDWVDRLDCPLEEGEEVELDTISTQLVELIRRLPTATSKTLVFVSTKFIATLLCKYLKKYHSYLLPDLIIGQTGPDGMAWRGSDGQKDKLRRFASGECRLLISTSVLEEGLDVSSCELVIRFGGIPSMTQLLQSKGRARAEGGKMIVICARRHKEQFELRQQQELFIDQLLDRFSAAQSSSGSGSLADCGSDPGAANYKGKLLEYLTKHCSEAPEFSSHKIGLQLFRSTVRFTLRDSDQSCTLTSAAHSNKRASEQDASKRALVFLDRRKRRRVIVSEIEDREETEGSSDIESEMLEAV